ncbi:MAG: hypothetical protein FJ255_01105 [Phycisphaerae bacterium]|nr:hypothetical protein [Phycisphaerae bacterium]
MTRPLLSPKTIRVRSALRFAPLGLGAAIAAGCAGQPAPKAVADGVTLRQASDAGAVLDLAVRAANFGGDPLPLSTVRYRVYVDGREVFEGSRSAEATLSRFGERTIHLPAVTTSPPGTEWRAEGTIEYVPSGAFARALSELGLARRTMRFEGAGTLTR